MGMKVTFRVHQCEGFERRPYVDVGAGDMTEDDSTDFVVDLSTVDGVRVPNVILAAIHKRETPDWYDGTAFRFVKRTVEGQHLLERVVASYGIRHPLRLSAPDTYAENLSPELGDKEKWGQIDTPDVDPTQAFIDMVDTSAEKYIYTLRVVNHDTDKTMYYVGESTQVMQRFQQHVSRGGDFAASRGKNTHVHEIVSIQPQSETTEEKRYEVVKDAVDAPVYGGQ
jgi:predicted GIY-YIG superfamily endonuclease